MPSDKKDPRVSATDRALGQALGQALSQALSQDGTIIRTMTGTLSDGTILRLRLEAGLLTAMDVLWQQERRPPEGQIAYLHALFRKAKCKGSFSSFVRCWIVFQILKDLEAKSKDAASRQRQPAANRNKHHH